MSDHFLNQHYYKKNSFKYGVHIIDLHSYYTTVVLSFLILRNSEAASRLLTLTLTMQRKENLIQCEDMVFISRAATSIAATALAFLQQQSIG